MTVQEQIDRLERLGSWAGRTDFERTLQLLKDMNAVYEAAKEVYNFPGGGTQQMVELEEALSALEES